jgi:hypothetical protein
MGLAGAGLALAAVGTAASVYKAFSGTGSTTTGGGGVGTGGLPSTYNGSGITPATDVAGAVAQGEIAADTANTQSADIATGQTQANALLDPYNTTGTAANKQLADIEGLNGPDAATAAQTNFTVDPGYQFLLKEGQRAVDSKAAATGMQMSGAQVKGEETYAEGLASQDFTNYVSRLNALSTQGLSAGTSEAGVDTGAAASQSKIAAALGTNEANAVGTGIGQVGAILGGLATSGINAFSNLGSGAGYSTSQNQAAGFGGGVNSYNGTAGGASGGSLSTGTGGGFTDNTSSFAYQNGNLGGGGGSPGGF